jgi:hypothetical protein
VPEGPLREDYYPQAVTPAAYHSVRSLMKARANDRGRVGIVRRNLFTGLAYAGNKDAPMHFVNKGNDAAKGGQYLVSDTSVRNYGEAWWAWPYDHFERAFVHYVIGVDFSGVILPGPERKSLEDELQYQNGQLAAVEGKVSRLIELAEGGGDIPQLKARIEALRKEAAQFKEAKRDLEARLYVAASGSVALQDTQKDLKRVLDRLQKPDGRDAVRTTLKRFIHRLSLWPFGLGQWKRPSREERTQGLACLPCFEVQFQQTDMRQIVVVHPKDPTILFWSEYFDETTNAAAVFTNNTKAILAMMFPKPKGRPKQRRKT